MNTTNCVLREFLAWRTVRSKAAREHVKRIKNLRNGGVANILQMLNDSELMEPRLVCGDKVFGQSLEGHTL